MRLHLEFSRTGLESLRREVTERLPEDIREQLHQEILAAFGRTVDVVKDATPMRKAVAPGEVLAGKPLKSQWSLEASRTATGGTYLIRNASRYRRVLAFLEFGARPHIIQSRRGRTLAFMDQEGSGFGGPWVLRRMARINHPGMRAFHPVRTGVEFLRRELGQRLRQNVLTKGRGRRV